MTTDSDSNGRENQPRRAGRPSKLTPELKEEILTVIGKGGCTYADACLKAGISTSTFQLWKQKGQEQQKGRFSAHLKKAEAEFRAHYLKKIQQAADESSVETRKTVRTIGEGDDQRTVQEVVEITRPSTWTAAAWYSSSKEQVVGATTTVDNSLKQKRSHTGRGGLTLPARGKTKAFLIGNKLKTKDLRHTAAERASGPTTKPNPKPRIAAAKG